MTDSQSFAPALESLENILRNAQCIARDHAKTVRKTIDERCKSDPEFYRSDDYWRLYDLKVIFSDAANYHIEERIFDAIRQYRNSIPNIPG